jgi:shikimate kinase
MTLWLVGMMGTGKSTSGLIAADLLEVGFRDIDDIIASSSGRTIADIWRHQGEAAFRRMEADVVAETEGFDGIVATGGGAVVDPGSRAVIRRAGYVVWLRATPETILSRIESSPRPPLGEVVTLGSIEALLAARHALYEQLATHRVDTDESSPRSVAEEIAGIWRA